MSGGCAELGIGGDKCELTLNDYLTQSSTVHMWDPATGKLNGVEFSKDNIKEAARKVWDSKKGTCEGDSPETLETNTCKRLWVDIVGGYYSQTRGKLLAMANNLRPNVIEQERKYEKDVATAEAKAMEQVEGQGCFKRGNEWMTRGEFCGPLLEQTKQRLIPEKPEALQEVAWSDLASGFKSSALSFPNACLDGFNRNELDDTPISKIPGQGNIEVYRNPDFRTVGQPEREYFPLTVGDILSARRFFAMDAIDGIIINLEGNEVYSVKESFRPPAAAAPAASAPRRAAAAAVSAAGAVVRRVAPGSSAKPSAEAVRAAGKASRAAQATEEERKRLAEEEAAKEAAAVPRFPAAADPLPIAPKKDKDLLDW